MTNRLTLMAVALLLAIVMVGTYIAIGILTTGTELQLADEIMSIAAVIAVVSFPFLVLAALGIAKKLPWMIGVLLTILVWAYFLYQSKVSEGASIGLGLLLVTSPVLIALTCVILAFAPTEGKSRPPE